VVYLRILSFQFLGLDILPGFLQSSLSSWPEVRLAQRRTQTPSLVGHWTGILEIQKKEILLVSALRLAVQIPRTHLKIRTVRGIAVRKTTQTRKPKKKEKAERNAWPGESSAYICFTMVANNPQ
jgi:hypothetical protein